MTTLTSSPDEGESSCSDQESFLNSTKASIKAPYKKHVGEAKKLMEIIDEKPNLVKYINTIKGSKKLQVLIESEMDNSITLNYLFSKIQNDIGKITNHPFGNYFLQKMIEKSSYSTPCPALVSPSNASAATYLAIVNGLPLNCLW